MSVWIQALKIFNKDSMWCMPRKGSPEHAKVKVIMDKIKSGNQKRIEDSTSSKKAVKPMRKLRTEKEKKESQMMSMEDRDAPEMKTKKWYDTKFWTDGRFDYELKPGIEKGNTRYFRNFTSVAEQKRTGILQGGTYAVNGFYIRNTPDDSPPKQLKTRNLIPKDMSLGESDDKIIMESGRKNTDYWISRSHCMHNAFYNTNFLKNDKTHTVRAGELFYKGDQKTDGEIDWKVKDFKDDLSNAHFWVESKDGTIDWIANFYMKNVDKKVWTKQELKDNGITYIPYKHEKDILEKAKKLYGNVGEEERKSAGEFKKCWRN